MLKLAESYQRGTAKQLGDDLAKRTTVNAANCGFLLNANCSMHVRTRRWRGMLRRRRHRRGPQLALRVKPCSGSLSPVSTLTTAVSCPPRVESPQHTSLRSLTAKMDVSCTRTTGAFFQAPTLAAHGRSSVPTRTLRLRVHPTAKMYIFAVGDVHVVCDILLTRACI